MAAESDLQTGKYRTAAKKHTFQQLNNVFQQSILQSTTSSVSLQATILPFMFLQGHTLAFLCLVYCKYILPVLALVCTYFLLISYRLHPCTPHWPLQRSKNIIFEPFPSPSLERLILGGFNFIRLMLSPQFVFKLFTLLPSDKGHNRDSRDTNISCEIE